MTTIKKVKEVNKLSPVYISLMEFLEIAGYETNSLTINQLASIKLNVINAIETTDLKDTDQIKTIN